MNELALCAGANGLGLGLKLVIRDIRTVCYVERESYAAANLVARMEDKTLDNAPIWDDIKTFDGKPWRGTVDILTAGYPCQPFSNAGKMLGEKDPRHLWPDVSRIIKECDPRFVFIENVANHLKLGFGQVKSELRSMGYRVEAGLFTAAEVGATHQRKRLFALAYTERSGINTGPEQPGWQTRSNINRSGPRADVANAHASGLGECGINKGKHENIDQSIEVVGNAQSIRLAKRQRQRRDFTKEQPTTMRTGSIPIFPPGPQQSKEWKQVIETDDRLKPAICRMVDGLAHRPDRLRLTGNGVVPLAAANAFLALHYALFGEYQCLM